MSPIKTTPRSVSNKSSIDNLVKGASAASDEMHRLDLEIASLRQEINTLQSKQAEVESKTKVEVAFDGLLNNERQREAAMLGSLATNATWQETTKDLASLKNRLAILEADRFLEYRKYRILLAQLESLSPHGV